MKNVKLINASAGSGKTYSLTTRIVDHLKNGLAPEALMATTFTNRAAGELRERIRAQLLHNEQMDEANRIYDGFIGTVNSICARLLQEYALEAGMSPAIEVMSEEDGDRLFQIAIDSVINTEAKKMEPAARRLDLTGEGSGYMKKQDWRDDVKIIVDMARSNRITPDDLRASCAASWESIRSIPGDPINKDLDQELGEAITLAVNQLDNAGQLTKGSQNALAELKDFHKRIKRLSWSDWIRLSKLQPPRDGQDIVAPVNVIADQVLQHPQFQNDLKQIIEGVFACAIKALEGYETFKREHGLMDFIDQETRVLDLAQYNEAFRASLSDRIHLLMVDEFQDTSPIQLALFLAVHELAGKSVWVGDPKQAIYGFRGTDPQLMEEVVALIKESGVLDSSWRSRENLINCTNALFSEVFHEMGAARVCLKIPDERAEKAKDGWLEVWHLQAKKNDEETAAIANGIHNLIERVPGIKPGDIAVFCRTNARCGAVAEKLEQLGIRVSVGQGSLLETRECRMALAALRYMNNPRDTVALAELIHMSADEHDANWLNDLMKDPTGTKEQWQTYPIITILQDGHNQMLHWTPMEALEQAISRINLLRRVKSSSNPGLAVSNLDALRRNCREYINQCASRRSSATVDGFLAYLKDTAPGQAQGTGDITIQVLTYHGAKGLEWPWIVLTDLDYKLKDDVFGVHIEAAPRFDPADPLANRKIRYWPWPFGSQKTYPLLDQKIDGLELKNAIRNQAEREARRLMYVGMTRAKDGMVMGIRKTSNRSGERLETAWLDILKDADGKRVIEMSLDTGSQILQIGNAQIPVTVFAYQPDSPELDISAEETFYLPAFPALANDYPAARINPSSLESLVDTDNVNLDIIENFNARIAIKGHPEMDALGNAIHAYLAMDYSPLPDEQRLELARELIKQWGVETAIEASEVVAAGQHLVEFLDRRCPGYTAFREWPMLLRNDKDQIMQGWIDLLLELPDGYVIIDHKSYPGPKPREWAKKYVPQLEAYKEAVEQTTGKPVIDMLIYLPVRGEILRIQ